MEDKDFSVLNHGGTKTRRHGEFSQFLLSFFSFVSWCLRVSVFQKSYFVVVTLPPDNYYTTHDNHNRYIP